MLLRTLLIVTLFVTILSAQTTRYWDKVFSDVDTIADVKYGSNINFTGVSQDLFLDVYTPSGDTEVDRPCIVLFHGGAFVVGAKNDTNVIYVCQELAMRGYVVVSAQYRLGVAGFTKAAFGQAILRAVQDAKGAVRFIKSESTTYGIDTERIAVGGFSAGGVTAVHYAYWDQDELEDSISNGVGDIEGESGTPNVASDIKCIVNCWGAIGDSTWINSADGDIPVISFHGTDDNVVPYGVGNALGMDGLEIYGSSVVDRRCAANGFTSEMITYEGMLHGHDKNAPQMDTTMERTVSFLYQYLVGESSIAMKTVSHNTLRGQNNVKFVNFNAMDSYLEGYKTFSVNGRMLHGATAKMMNRKANGVLIFRKIEK